jgi:predicted CopG family antitoxin
MTAIEEVLCLVVLAASIRMFIRVCAEKIMHKKLTITLDERVYEGLHTVVGRRHISRFIESLVRPHVIGKDLEIAYQRMASEEAREVEALEWAEATCGDIADEAR